MLEAEADEEPDPFLLTIFTELRRCRCTETELLFLLPVVDELTGAAAFFLVSLLFFCFLVRLLLPLPLPLSEEVPV